MRTDSSGRGYQAALMMAALLTIRPAGCHGNRPADDEHEDEHAGHVAPAHKPKDLPQAVRRLRELQRAIDEGTAGGRWKALVDDRTIPIALDIATWLPEIAAGSEMPEKPWDVVNAQSEALVAAYKELLGRANAAGPGDARPAVHDAGRSISALEGLLAESDPRWFEGVARRNSQAN
jgi:hypothetical protein